MHAFSKLNVATIPAQKSMPIKNIIMNGLSKSTIIMSMDIMTTSDHIIMRERYIPFSTVSTPSGML